MYIRVSEAKYRAYREARAALCEGPIPTPAQRRRVLDMHYELFYTTPEQAPIDLMIVEHPIGEAYESEIRFVH